MKPRRARTLLDLLHVLLSEVQANPALGETLVLAPDNKGVMLPVQVASISANGKTFVTIVGRK